MATYAYTFNSGDTVTPTRINDARTISDIVNADVKSDAAIAGTKIAPDFGSQNITTTGNAQSTNVTALGSGFIGLRQRCHADAGAGSPELISSRSRGTASSPTIVGSGDSLLFIAAQGYDGSTYRNACFIGCDVDATPGSSDMPGRIVFSTSPDGSASPVERMRITSAGRVGIGTSIPEAPLEVFISTGNTEYLRAGSSVSDRSLRFSSFAVSGTNSVGHDIKAPEANGTLTFSTVSSERVRITNTGAVCVGTTSPTADHLLHVAGRTIIRGAVAGTTAAMPSETTMLSVLNGASYNGTPSVSLSIGASNYDSVDSGVPFQWVFLTPSEATGSALTINERTFNGSYSRTERLRVDSSGIAVAGDATISDKLIHAGDTNTCVRFPAADTVAVETAGSERLRVDSSGNLGIGTTSPSHKLSVVGDINTTESFLVDSTKVVGNRVTGWGAPTGTISRSALTLTASATYSQSEINTIIQALKAVVTDLRTHGLIGN
jgi:hypothetical protein